MSCSGKSSIQKRYLLTLMSQPLNKKANMNRFIYINIKIYYEPQRCAAAHVDTSIPFASHVLFILFSDTISSWCISHCQSLKFLKWSGCSLSGRSMWVGCSITPLLLPLKGSDISPWRPPQPARCSLYTT